ncbi:GAMMA-TUBULIN COMPLEX PROTEIN 4 isoform X1 [Wolffia australiana]
MLHELLLALVGYTGDFVIDVRAPREPLDNFASEISDDSPTFRLAADISFIHPSERCVIERLLPLGFYYRELDRFAASCRNLSSVVDKQGVCRKGVALGSLNGGSSSPSTYRRAVANGVVEILSAYRAAVLQLEQRLLGDPEPILATVTQGMSKFLAILPPLHELIVEIERDDVRGGQLLDLLHKRCHCGMPELQSCIQRLLWHGHQVLYHQLTSWLVYGILQDQHGEFFIARESDNDGPDNESSDRDSGTGSIDKTSTDASYGDWNLGFHINLGMLPRHIDMRTAESVLFAGKAITVLRNPSSFRFREALVHQQSYKVSNKFQGISGNFAFQKETRTPSFAGELFPQSESDKIEGMLQELKDLSEFQSRKFTLVVNSIRTIAANHLWQLVVVRADLNGHLKALKDYFLLAKGDFFQCFLDESRQLMKLPPRQSTAEADLMVPFQLAALKTISDEDKYFSRVSIRMPAFGSNEGTGPKDFGMKLGIFQGTDSSEGSLDGWDCISLDYSLNWPLPMFFTQDVLTKYGRIFQYLLQLKRTQMELEKSWAAVMQQNHFEFAGYRKDRKNYFISQMLQQQSRPMWRVREHMAFLIRNLQFYIQVDVIESQWNILQAHVQECSDFTELVAFHQEYLIALISQSFLDIGSISRILNSIMKLCLRFCWNVENQESISNSSELEQIIEEFNKKSNSLYTILRNSRIAGSQRAPSLRRFLMRLNFNSLFEVRGLNISRSRPTPPTAL